MPHSIIFDTPELLDGHPCAPPSVTWCAASSRTIAAWFSLLLPAQMSSWWVPSFLLPPALPRRHDWHIDGGDVQDAHEVTHGPPSWLFEWSDAVMVRSLGLPLFPMVGERWRVVRMTISLVFLFGINKANTEPVLVEEAGHPFWLLLLWFLRFCWEMKWSKLWLTCV